MRRQVDLIHEYWLDVFEPFLVQLECGYTPNPDLLCNVHVKFGPMWKYARTRLGADLLATGHYAQVVHADPSHATTIRSANLARGTDCAKDQSYFLAAASPLTNLAFSALGFQLCVLQVDQAIWKRVVFPLGTWSKEEVRARARLIGLSVDTKKSSTGLCFIGKRNFGNFIGQYLEDRAGPICCVSDDRVSIP